MRNVGDAAKLHLQHLLTSLRRSGEPVELQIARDIAQHDREIGTDSADQPIEADHENALPGKTLVHAERRVGKKEANADQEAGPGEVAERGASLDETVHDAGDTAKCRGEGERHRHHEIARQLEHEENRQTCKREQHSGDEHFAGFFQRKVGGRSADQSTEYATRHDCGVEAVADHVPAHQQVVDEGEKDAGDHRTDRAEKKVELLVHCMSFLIAKAIFWNSS